jgi:hypothetical protein
MIGLRPEGEELDSICFGAHDRAAAIAGREPLVHPLAKAGRLASFWDTCIVGGLPCWHRTFVTPS